MSEGQQVASHGPCDQASAGLDVAILDDESSTVIHLKGSGGRARMTELGPVFDKLGVEVLSCSTMQTAGSSDMTLVVVDRHDSQPLHDCLKQSLKEGLHSVLQNSDACPWRSPRSPVAAGSKQPAQQLQLQLHRQIAQIALQQNSSTDSRNQTDLCRADSASASQRSATCSRQPSFAETLRDKPLMQALEQQCCEQDATTQQNGTGGSLSRESSRSSIRFNPGLRSLAEETASPTIGVPSTSLRPALTIDIPLDVDAGLQSSGSFVLSNSGLPSEQTTPTEFGGFEPIRHPIGLSVSSRNGGASEQLQQGLHVQDLTERLVQLGLHKSPSKQLAHDSSSDEEDHSSSDKEDHRSSCRSSRRTRDVECRWQGPLQKQYTLGSNSAADLMDSVNSSGGGAGTSSVRRTTSALNGEAAAAALGGFSQPERSARSENTLGRQPLGSVPASPFFGGEKARAAALLSPCMTKSTASARRRPPPRTPSRIILSPVAPDGTMDPQGQPRLFVSIPKQSSEEKRSRRPVGRSQTGKTLTAQTPSGSSARQILQQLAGQDSADKFASAVTSPTAAEAAAAAEAASKMSFNVAAAAAQLLGKNRDAAAAAIATAVAGDSSPLMCSPAHTAPSSAANSADVLPSPVAATPRGVPLTPATPVHPVVAAVAAVAFKAAAEAVGEAAAAEAAGATDVIEEGIEEGSSMVGSVDSDAEVAASQADSADDSSSEEWWCGSLTGMVVKDVMTGPLRVIHQDADVAAARQLMVQQNLLGILVDTGTDTPGFLTRRDFFKPSVTRRGHKKKHVKITVRDIMSHPVIAVEATQPIEFCAQMMQEQGIRRAAVRDTEAADPANPLSAYIGLVSDATIFKYLGLYPEESTAFGENEQGFLGLPPPAMRLHQAAETSQESSSADTPSSSRAATPLVPVARTSAQQQGAAEQQQQQQQSARSYEGTVESVMSSARSADSSGIEADRSSSDSTIIDVKAEQQRAGGSVGSVTASDSSNGSAAPDALLRYKTAAALWEIDMDEMEFIKKIGEGSFGEVWVANYRGTKVAVKRLHVLDIDDVPHSSMNGNGDPAKGGSQAAFRQFFEREIAILASIRHPHVVNFIGACHKPGQRSLVTEYCARGSLDTVLHKSGLPLDLFKRVEFAMDIARGMACLHAQRPIIIHRDLKTANLLVSARFEIKVADFGLSRIKDASHLQVSRAGLEGTIEYCAPEVLRGEPFTERCDVYSFGVVLWELLLRQRPYSDHEVPVYLLMVNIGSGSLKLPEVPVDAATPGLCALVDSCLAFAAADRPDFREILQALEVEYKALRATQQQRQGSAQQQAQQQQSQQQQQTPGVPCCDSTPSSAVQGQSQQPGVVSNTPVQQSPAGSIDARHPAVQAAAAAHAAIGYAAEAGTAPYQQQYIDGYLYQQQQFQQQLLQAPVMQYQQQPVQQQPMQQQLQRHRLSQADSLTSSGDSSVLPPVAAVAGVPFGAMFEQQHSQQLMSVPLPQLLVPQQFVASMPGSRRGSPRHQQQNGARVLSAFGNANLCGAQQQHGGASGGGGGGSCSKPPRQKQHLSRARSMPIPQSMSWDVDEDDEADAETDGTDGPGPGDMLQMEDSYGSSDYGGMPRYIQGYSPCPPSGQLCMVLDPAASANSGMLPQLPPGQVFLAHPQQQLLLAQGQAVQAVPVVLAQPAGMQYQPYQQQGPGMQQQYYNDVGQSSQPLPQYSTTPMQQQYVQQQCVQPQYIQPQYVQQPYMVQQPSQPLHIPLAQQAQRVVLRNMYTPSPSPAGMATPPLSSSPSMNNLNPLAVMAAAGAAAQAARRDGAGSGAGSPVHAAALNRSGSFNMGMHRRRSSQGGVRGSVPTLPLMQMNDAGTPACLTARDTLSGTDTGGCSTPIMGGMVPGGVAAPLLLQRLDSLHRSGSASPSRSASGPLHVIPAPALQSEHSGQIVGVLVATAGSGPPSVVGSPIQTHIAPVTQHRLASSRLAYQGSYELQPIAMAPAGAAAGPADGQQQQQPGISYVNGVPCCPMYTPQAASKLGPAGRRLSLLRIDSNSKDRPSSPFAMVEANAAMPPAAGRSPFAAADLQSTSASSGAAGSMANAGTGYGTSHGKPTPVAISSMDSSVVTTSSRLTSPFAAASICSPFAAASAAPSFDEQPELSMSCNKQDTGLVADIAPRGDDTTPRNDDKTPRDDAESSPRGPAGSTGSTRGKVVGAGGGAAYDNGGPSGCSGKSSASPFFLLQQAATDDTGDQ